MKEPKFRDDSSKKKQKFNLYTLLNPQRDGKGVEKEDPNAPRNFTYYFQLLGRRLSSIFTVNLMTILGNFPILFLFLAMAGYFSENGLAPQSVLSSVLYGSLQYGDPNPVSAALFGIHGVQSSVRIFSTVDIVLIVIGLVGLLITFGCVNCGVTYLYRNMVRGEAVFLWGDFIGTIRKNWKQGLILGILDLVFLALIVFDLIFFYYNLGSFISSMLLWSAIFIGIFYLMMRMYMYLLVVTFDLSLFKILKNSLIFSLLGIKRNLAALFGSVLILVLNYMLLLIFFPLGFIAPFIITVGLLMFTATYAAWPCVKKVMIDPYYNEDGSEKATANV